MNRNEFVSMLQLQGGAKLVKVTYLGEAVGLPRIFKCLLPQSLVFNDLVVVETPRGFGLATVVEADFPMTANLNFGDLYHVVAKVDTAWLHETKMAEAKFAADLAMVEMQERLNAMALRYGAANAQQMVTPALLGKPIVGQAPSPEVTQ